MHTAATAAALILIGMLGSTGCTPAPITPASSDAPIGQGLGALAPAPPETDVVGTGTVLDDGSGAKLCLGPIMESYPPQCHGITLAGWDWGAVSGFETAGDVRWGQYAVIGSYDGEIFASTGEPVLLALYDVPAMEDPLEPGTTGQAELDAIVDDIDSRGIPGELSVGAFEGRVWLDVVWDDGTLQRAADDDFGAGAVIVRPVLREVS